MGNKSTTTCHTKWMACLISFAVGVLMIPLTGGAQEAKWLVPPAFEGEELVKVREWEKTWVGKKVTKDNIDQVKEFVPEMVYNVFTNPDKWGGDHHYSFDVVPYKTFNPTPDLVAATQKYSPLAQGKINADGILENYQDLAGIPFPEPKTGDELAWNFFLNTFGDEFLHWEGLGSPVDARTKIERGAVTSHWECWYVNRVNRDPKPKVPKNRRKIRNARFMHMGAPPHMTDFQSLHIQYIDFGQRDGWMYWPRFRKITRIQTDVRDDVYDGLDWIQDDFPRAWDEIPQVCNWKLIGRKKLLLPRHVETGEFSREKGMVMFSGIKRELINTYMVEATYKKSGYVYSKQIFYYDPETFTILFKYMYNKQGELWKNMEGLFHMRKIWGGEIALAEGYYLVDLIRRHGTVDVFPNETDFDKKWDRNKVYSIRNLDRRAY